jgi:hypothetical protein
VPTQQTVLELLEDGAFDGDTRINNLIQSSLHQLGNNAADAALYESMLLDVATVMYGRNPKAAVCAWRATDKHAAARLEQLIDCSLIKVVSGFPVVEGEQLWMHDVIKGIATRAALGENKQRMTRVWLPDQVKISLAMLYMKHRCALTLRCVPCNITLASRFQLVPWCH